MFFYHLYELNIASELSLPMLLSGKENESCDVTIMFSSLPENIARSISMGKNMGFGKQISWLHTEFGTFTITEGNHISIAADSSAEVWQLRPFVLGFCFANLFLQRNIPAFHCSTVSYQEKAYLFSGLSGAGKSTTAAIFMNKGALMIADDMVVTPYDNDTFYALPAYPRQKLCKDAVIRQGYNISDLSMIDEERDKYAISCPEQFCYQPQPIGAFFYLEPSSDSHVIIERVPPMETLNLITRNLFLSMSLRITGIPDAYLVPCIQFSQTIPVYRLLRPLHREDTTDEIYHSICSIIEKL